MSWLTNLRTSFALWSFRIMKERAEEVVEAFPSYAVNRDQSEVLIKEVVVGLAAVFWAGGVLGLVVGGIVMGVVWLIVDWLGSF